MYLSRFLISMIGTLKKVYLEEISCIEKNGVFIIPFNFVDFVFESGHTSEAELSLPIFVHTF
jgi:hypothetical protein